MDSRGSFKGRHSSRLSSAASAGPHRIATREDANVTLTTARAPDWDPRAPSVLSDQRRAYDEMRRRCPVAYSDFLGWSLFRYVDVLHALEDPGTFSSATKRRAIPNGLDAPEHTAYRRILDPHFGPDRMTALEPRARQIAAAPRGGEPRIAALDRDPDMYGIRTSDSCRARQRHNFPGSPSRRRRGHRHVRPIRRTCSPCLAKMG